MKAAPRARWRDRAIRWLPLLVLAALGGAAPASAETLRVPLGDGLVATYEPTPEPALFLEAVPQASEGMLAFCRRFTGSSSTMDAVAAANGNRRRLLAGVRYRVPYGLLLGRYQLQVIRALFTEDRAQADGWLHVVTPEVPGQRLWHVSQWLTGRGENFVAIRRANGLVDEGLVRNQRLLIPRALLLPPFRGVLPAPSQVAAVPPPRPALPPASGDLHYGEDPSGEYAEYRLKAGEALYSAVVVRFTGRTFADDVNALAAELATRNGIPDVTDMAIGQRVRIPIDLLLPEHLPAGHPRRAAYERGSTESALYSNTVRASQLEGITVIIDAGHGGQDPGATVDGVWESIHVYDIAARVRQLLRRTTAANVDMTIRDGDAFRVPERDGLQHSRGHRVLTSPPYAVEDAVTALHFRWYLANSLYRRALKRNGGDIKKVVFLSIHADALHPSLRGAMVYVPAASLTSGSFGKQGAVFNRRAEVREKPRVSYSWKERTRSEGLSRQLANHLITSFRRHGMAIHSDKPIRDRIIRSRRSRPFVPAVVRYNAVPAKVLVEVSNLGNREDRKLIRTADFRQRAAQAIVDGILAYYGQSPAPRRDIAAP